MPFCVSDGETWLPGYVARDGEPAGFGGGGDQDDPEHWEGRRVRCVYAPKRIPVLDRRATREERAEKLREAVGLVLTLVRRSLPLFGDFAALSSFPCFVRGTRGG